MDTSDGVVEVQEEQPDEHMVPPEPDVDATRADDDDEGGVDDAGIAWKKERVAVIFGYIGARFQGLQRNPGAFTVEDELEGAIYRAGGISKANLGDFHKVGWNRAARTDKGVHAMGQVVSLRMRVPLCDASKGDPRRGTVDYALMRDRINAHLGTDIRVFEVCRVTGTFSSHTHCSGRQYEYVLPTIVLQPPRRVQHISRDPPMPEALKKLLRTSPAHIGHTASRYHDRFVNGEALALGSREQSKARAVGAEAAAARAASSFAAIEAALARSWELYPSQRETFAPVAVVSADAYQTGAAYFAAQSQLAASRAACLLSDTPGPHFRASVAVLERLAAAVACFRGTHAFHNFTPRLTFGDAATSRYISDARVSRPFIVGEGDDALECVRITFVGQSFLLNHIRHMVGLAADVARGAAPSYMLQIAFGYALVKLPLAPAEGLYLDRCFYVAYDRQAQLVAASGRVASERKLYPSLTTRSPSGEAATEAFKRDVLLPHIFSSVSSTKPFHAYINGLLDEPMRYRVHIPPNLEQMLKRGVEYKRNPCAAAGGFKRLRAEEAAAKGDGEGASGAEAGSSSAVPAGDMSGLEWMARFGGAAAAAVVASQRSQGGEAAAPPPSSDAAAAAALVFAPVDVGLLNGGFVSKEAIARSEFRQARKALKHGGGSGDGGDGRPNVWRQDTANAAAASAAAPAPAPPPAPTVWRGGARKGGGGGWRGGARRPAGGDGRTSS